MARSGWARSGRHGTERLGRAWRSEARQAGRGIVRTGAAGLGNAGLERLGWAKHGEVGQARLGEAWNGGVRQARHGADGYVEERSGEAG